MCAGASAHILAYICIFPPSTIAFFWLALLVSIYKLFMYFNLVWECSLKKSSSHSLKTYTHIPIYFQTLALQPSLCPLHIYKHMYIHTFNFDMSRAFVCLQKYQPCVRDSDSNSAPNSFQNASATQSSDWVSAKRWTGRAVTVLISLWRWCRHVCGLNTVTFRFWFHLKTN